jgi:phage terminase large subunit-like protein
VPFSDAHANIACNFFERVLKHTQDEWSGKPFLLAPWQEDALREIFGLLDHDGNRQIQQVYLEVPKKSGKTEFCAGLILLVLLLNQKLGCQVYGAAAAQRQALNVYRAAHTMVEQSAVLRKEFRVLDSTSRILKKSDPNSFYAAVAADGDLSDGVNPACTVADEVHRWRTRKQLENWDVLTLGGITRREMLSIAITTAGVQSESPLAWRLHEKTLRIKAGVIQDATFYGKIYAADATDDWSQETTWIKANPSLKQNGGFLDISRIRKQFEAALSDPEAQRSFRRYFLNLWDQKEKRAVDLRRWELCKGDWEAVGLQDKQPEDDVRPLHHDMLARFIGRRCWAGVDISMTTDFTAVALLFPEFQTILNPEGKFEGWGASTGFYDVIAFYWMPEEGIRRRELRDGMPYRTWADQGFMELSSGNVIDIREVRKRLEWASRMFDLQEICFDPSEARQISVPMVEEGYTCVDIRQGYSMLSEPCKKFLEIIACGKLRHGGHPVLRWNAHSLSTKEHDDQLMWSKPERHRDSARIDGISALTNALARAMLDAGPSVYESRGLITT